MFPSFQIAKLNIEVELIDDHPAFDFLGAKLRGGFGRGLLAYLCDHPDLQICDACPRFRQCRYPRTFKVFKEALPYEITGHPRGYEQNLTPSFVIDTLYAPHRQMYQGEKFSFDIILINEMCQMVDTVIQAFTYFGSQGIDYIIKHNSNNHLRQSRFKILSVRDLLNDANLIYSGREIAPHRVCKIDDLIAQASFPTGHRRIEIHFVSPIRIDRKQSQHWDRKTGLTIFKDFFDLLIDAIDRVAELWQIYDYGNWIGQAEYWRWRSRLLAAGKEKIHSLPADLRMVNLKRYSNLKGYDLDMSGFIGQMKLAGDFSDFGDVLLAGELLHIGKETSLGLGKYVIRYS